MKEFLDLLRNKRTLIGIIVLGVLGLGLFAGTILVRQQQIIKSRAAADATCSNGAHKVNATWPECRGCDEGIVTCTGQDSYSFSSVRNPSPNCGAACGGTAPGNSPRPGGSSAPGPGSGTWFGCSNWSSTMKQGTPQDQSCKQNNPDSVAWQFVCNACGTPGSSYEKRGECGSQCDSNGSGRLNGSCDWWSCQSITPPNATCKVDRQSPDLGSACTICIANNNPNLTTDLRSYNHTDFDGCSVQKLINFWCNGGVSPEATANCYQREKTKCSSVCDTTVAPPGGESDGTGSGDSVRTCKNETKTWAQIDQELKGAQYPGPFDHTPGELAAYNRRACPGGGTGGKYTVSGKVFQADGTTPAPGVKVEVWNDLTPVASSSNTTDSNGVFTVSNFIDNGKAYAVRIPKTQGTMTITKVSTLNDTRSRQFAGQFAGQNTPKGNESYEFQLTNDTTCATNCDFKIESSATPASPGATTGTIQGKVVNASGDPVSGVKVWVNDQSSSTSYEGGKYKSVTSGSDGKFSAAVTFGTNGYWVRIPDQATLGDDGKSNVAIFTSKQPTKTPYANANSQSYEAQPYNNISHGCWNDCDFTVTLIPAATTVSYRVSESLADFTDLNTGWQEYTSEGMIIDYSFIDSNPGVKFIFVQFKDSNGKVTTAADCPKCQAQITLLGEAPSISSCDLNITGANTEIVLVGQHFGTTPVTVISGTTPLTVQSGSGTEIKLIWQNAPVGQSFPILLTNSNGQTATAQCSSSPLSLGAKVFCRAPSGHQTDNVAMELAGAFAGGTLVKQKVSIDKDGNVLGLDKNFLQTGKQYNLSLKAPRGLRKTATFTAGSGTTNIPNFILPIGDIFPADGGDGIINSLDKSELNRQWNISADTIRTGDFNLDRRVNSIDWACMRYDFNKSDEAEPVVSSPENQGVGVTVRQIIDN